MQLELSAEEAAFRDEMRTWVGLPVARASRHIGQEAIQLHGGIAMTAELPVGVGTAHLGMLERWLGGAQHHLTRLADRVTAHGGVEALR